ncbi:GNAT family N-acetyltransferase [Streptomyces sp. NPDC059698]|uniref:GNAT family N-acetyltransferase n=1 Tax=unclassified Streptomyces TaxID=2593676 RepID=UPI00093A67EF|nr:GNAT family N-acetyltransferase [Streptomyces sp. CB02366]OKJ34292.1 glycosyl transferase family 1 [Streptomyces sp. CB02366]
MTAPRPGGLAVTLCRDFGEFGALAGEWDALHRRCATATPFQSHAWLHSWWISYGQEGRLRVLLVRRAGRLIGAAPLMLVHRPMPLLVPMGGAVSDFFDILLDEEEAGYAVGALGRGLDRAARHTVVDLREVRPDASAQLLFGRWAGARSRLADSTCMELPAAPLDGVVARLTGSRGQRLRSKLRKVEALGVEAHRVPGDAVPAAIGTLLRLHERQWEGRAVNPEHLRARFSDHLIRSVGRMVGDGTAALTEFRLNGEVVASNLSLESGRLAGGYLYGADPVLRERKVDVSTMLLREVARQAADGGREVLSLLRGAEAYKNHWGPSPVVNQRLLLARPGLEPLLRLRESQVAVRERAAESVKARFPAARAWHERLTALPVIGR